MELFEIFESVLEKVDALKGELYILGDLNCDLLAKSHDCHANPDDYFSLQKQTPHFLRGFWRVRLLALCEL